MNKMTSNGVNKYIVSIIALAILGTLLLPGILGGSGTGARGEVAAAITVEPAVHDFGDIGIFDGKVEKDFILTNQGEESITILNGTTSCGCTEGSIDGILFGMHEGMAESVLVEPGETKTLTVIYDQLAHGPDAVGSITRQIFLKTNSTETPEIEINISANVVKEAN